MHINNSDIKRPGVSLVDKLNFLLKDMLQTADIFHDLDHEKSPSFSIKLFLPLNNEWYLQYYERKTKDFKPESFYDATDYYYRKEDSEATVFQVVQGCCLIHGFNLVSIKVNKAKMGLEIEIE